MEKASGQELFRELRHGKRSALSKYRDTVVGQRGLLALLRHELIAAALSNLPGMVGLGLRKLLYPGLFKHCGRGVVWGRGTTLRHPGKMVIGNGVMADDNCLLDARGCGVGEFSIGDDAIISRNVVIASKGGPLQIGARANVGVNAALYSIGGLEIGDDVGVAAQCFIGGGGYRADDPSRPIIDQKADMRGVKIGSDCWIGAGVVVLDGVTIGDHSVIGAGSVVTHDLPPHSVAVGVPARAKRDRS